MKVKFFFDVKMNEPEYMDIHAYTLTVNGIALTST